MLPFSGKFILEIYRWIKSNILGLGNNLLFFFFLLVLLLIVSQYPVRFDFQTVEIQESTKIVKNTQYEIKSQIKKDGTNVCAYVRTYYCKVENKND